MKELFYFLHGTEKDAADFLKEHVDSKQSTQSKFWVEDNMSAEEAEECWGSEVEDPNHRVFLIHADVTDHDFDVMELWQEWMER